MASKLNRIRPDNCNCDPFGYCNCGDPKTFDPQKDPTYYYFDGNETKLKPTWELTGPGAYSNEYD